jgi:2-iminobutanoate/2-iminopropanoate deaminase
MKKEILTLPNVKITDYPFNHVIKAGNTLYLTSQLSCNLKTNEIISGNIESQTKNTLENVKYLLENSNSSLKNILKVVIYMRNISEFNKMNKVYKEYFISGEEPARVTVQAPSPIEGIDIEIEVVALTN